MIQLTPELSHIINQINHPDRKTVLRYFDQALHSIDEKMDALHILINAIFKPAEPIICQSVQEYEEMIPDTKRLITEIETSLIMEMWNAGYLKKEIASELSISSNKVGQIIKEHS